MGLRHQTFSVFYVTSEHFLPVGDRFNLPARRPGPERRRAPDQAWIARDRPGISRNSGCETAAVPGAWAFDRIIHARAAGRYFIFLLEVMQVSVLLPELPFARITNLLCFIFLLMSFLLLIRNSLAAQVRMFALQSSVLSALAAVVAYFSGNRELFGVAVVFALIKVVVIPNVLNRAVTKIGLQRAVAPYLGTSITLAICAGLVILAFYVMAPVTASNPLPTADGIPLAFAGVLIGLFTTVNRRRALTQILGFLMLENGIFMTALLATYGVPLIVEMGVFLDVLVAVLIMEVFVYQIRENFESIDVKQLGSLKG